MEVLVKKLHATVDKFATLNKEGNAILYTTRQQPKVKQVISLAEGKRIFEDLYGDIAKRWEVTDEYAELLPVNLIVNFSPTLISSPSLEITRDVNFRLLLISSFND